MPGLRRVDPRDLALPELSGADRTPARRRARLYQARLPRTTLGADRLPLLQPSPDRTRRIGFRRRSILRPGEIHYVKRRYVPGPERGDEGVPAEDREDAERRDRPLRGRGPRQTPGEYEARDRGTAPSRSVDFEKQIEERSKRLEERQAKAAKKLEEATKARDEALAMLAAKKAAKAARVQPRQEADDPHLGEKLRDRLLEEFGTRVDQRPSGPYNSQGSLIDFEPGA